MRGNICYFAGSHLAQQRLIGTEQKLLARLAARVERSRNLCASERTIGERAAVFARERNTLRHALIDDVQADLRQSVDVGFAAAEVAAFDRVVEEPINAVAVVLIILRGVDSALRGDAVGAPRTILKAETLDVVAKFGERSRGRSAGKSGADDDDVVLAFVGRIDQLHIESMPVPAILDRS